MILNFTVRFILWLIIPSNSLAIANDPFDFEEESNKIVNSFLSDLKRKEQIFCQGSGGGSRGEINTINIYWESTRILNLDQTRRLIVSAAENLFQRFNENKIIRPYLHNFPFGSKNVTLSLRFLKNKLEPEQVAYVTLINNKIHYCSFDKQGNVVIGMHAESYDEALNIFQSELTQKIK